MAGFALGLGSGLAPGPLFGLTLSTSLTRGAKAGIQVAVSPLITDTVIILLTLTLVSQLPPGVVTGLTLLGAVVVGAGASVVVTTGAVLVGAGTLSTVVVDSGTVVVAGAVVVVVGSAKSGVSANSAIEVPAGSLTELGSASSDSIDAAEMPGRACIMRAARPATCGEAIDVPDIVADDADPLIPAEVIEEPGAQRSTQLPVFE